MVRLRLMPAPDTTAHHEGEISACCFSPDGHVVVSGGWDGHLCAWDMETGRAALSVRAGTKPISACAVAPEGDRWLAGNLDGILSRWDPMSQRSISTFLAHTRPISDIVFSPDGQTLVTTAWDCHVNLWDRTNERDCRILTGHSDIVDGCRFTPNGRTILSWSYDGTLRLWEVARARLARTLKGHADRVTTAAVAPDGSWAASGSRDGRVILWDLEAECEAGSVQLEHEVRACFFLLHGETFGTVENDGHIRLFSVPDLAPQTDLATGRGANRAAIAPTGNSVALGGTDGMMYFVAIEGFDSAPLVVTATQTSRRTANPIQKLFGKSRLVHAYQCTCPACRQSFEVAGREPAQPAPCPNCQRSLRIRPVVR